MVHSETVSETNSGEGLALLILEMAREEHGWKWCAAHGVGGILKKKIGLLSQGRPEPAAKLRARWRKRLLAMCADCPHGECPLHRS